ncbi:GNAT family N-acetyltransferase [Microterricola viridarii]|uniref:Putative acetyltransferase n=1 Tax=Microterricola viridarii TaxID=412690 RepID=A0A1H1P116_9MICO|nr:GNAT family N-acetyltransferase [Microterricola viridarii]SDS04884.1 putative acetyltransferase [Microterricola viridarii]
MTTAELRPTAPRPALSIDVEAPRQDELLALLEQSTVYARSLGYPPESNFLLDVDALERSSVRVYVARDEGGRALGLAALVALEPDADGGRPGDAELKRMFVGERARGLGVAGALLRRIEADAAERGIRRLVLETGDLHASALALYGKHGYREIPQFGQYIGEAHSICLAKPLAGE